MSKSKRGAKGAGFDYDGRRSRRSRMLRGPHVKPLTHRRERRGEIRLIQQELEAFEEDRAADQHDAYYQVFEDDYGDVFLTEQLFHVDDMIAGRTSIDPAFADAIQRRLAERAAIRKWDREFRQSEDECEFEIFDESHVEISPHNRHSLAIITERLKTLR